MTPSVLWKALMIESLTAAPSPVAAALQCSRFTVLRRIDVVETPTEVVLTGVLPRYYLKQVAQETVLPLIQGRQLRNQIEVIRAWRGFPMRRPGLLLLIAAPALLFLALPA